MKSLGASFMVNPKEFKQKIGSVLSQGYKVEFLGKNFDQIVMLLTETKAEKMYKWVSEVVDRKIEPIVVGSKKQYKDWVVSELLTFRYPFSINNTEYRILFVKVKNSIYIEFHLGDHKYYTKMPKNQNI